MDRWITVRTRNITYAKRKNFYFVASVFLIIYAVIFFFMLIKANTEKVFAYSDVKRQKEVLKAIRGTIYDKNMDIIAGNFYIAKISIRKDILEKIGYENYKEILKIFGKSLTKKQYKKLLKSERFTVKVAEIPYNDFFEGRYLRKISSVLSELKLGDVLIFDYEYKRYYSTDRFYSRFLAYMYQDKNGLKKIGLERTFDDILKGQDGERTYFFNKKVGFYTEKRPVDGESIVLTIDSSVQFICEKVAKSALNRFRADNVYVIVSKPKTGEILALTSISRKYGKMNGLIIRGAYEPGSTMKPIVGALALDLGVVRISDSFYCEEGVFKVKKRVIRDHERFKDLTFREIIWHSSNIGMSKIALKMDDIAFYQGLKMFGFGMRTGLPFHKESRGIFPSKKDFNVQRKISMSFGYGIGVTAVQMATALNAVINGGYYVSPVMVKGKVKPEVTIAKACLRPINEVSQRRWKVIDETTSSVMRQILKGVVEHGTGRQAAIEGISIGGKTGTTKKLIGSRYSKNYIASFYGFFPVNDPAISVYVVVDNPRGKKFYGGEVAAPVFKEIVQKIYPYLVEEISGKTIPLPDQPLFVYENESGEKTGNDPLGIKGLSFKQAMQKLASESVNFVCVGHGFVSGYKKVGKNLYKLYGSIR